MSKKTELIQVFKGYKAKYDDLQVKKLEIDSSLLYTPEGKKEAISRLLEDFLPTVQRYHDNAAAIIDKCMEDLVEKWKNESAGKLLDTGYQSGLSNVIKMLELGAIQKKEDLQNIIDTYVGDFNALAVIEKVLKKSRNELLKDVTIPKDNREENRKLLNQLRKNVDSYISTESLRVSSKSWNTFNQGHTDISTSMDSMSEFIEKRLGDNLELLS